MKVVILDARLPATQERADELRDVFHRMRNVLDVYPASTWDLEEARSVLLALEGIVRGRRQVVGDVITFPSPQSFR